MANVGYATLQVIPSVRGISDELRRQLIGPAGDAGNRAGDNAGGGFRDAFTGALAALGITEIASKIGEQFSEAWDQALEQSSVAGTLKAQLGASAKDAARYGKVAGQLFAGGVTDDLETAAESVRATLQGGLVPPSATKELRALSTEMSDFATSFGTDLNLQSQAVAAQLKNGLARNAQEALDVMTVGFQKLGPNAEDLLETFQEYPVQLKKLGLDSKTALGLFSQGIKGGARDTDIIADALKEFSIRSIDMSASSRAAYKGLGLDAKTMEQQIAKGGASATSGLQTVLDKLRGIHDPVKRESLAVGLFGTQAEELGKSLFKLDPSKAVGVMGDVSGAAQQLGKDLRSGPGYEVKVFQRQLQQAFVNILGGQVLPVAARIGGTLNKTVLPPLTQIATVVGGTVITALKNLWTAGTGVVNWLREMGTWLIPISILVVGFTASILAQQIATAATTAVFAIYRGAILAWTAVQRGATIAQLAFNAVMNANVIVLVITAIVALGAALVVAYQRSETFRKIVNAAWAGIQAGALFLWNSVLKPAFAGIMIGLRALGTAFSWLWSTVLKPVFSFINTAVRILLTVIVITVFGPIYLAVKQLGSVFSWLWTVAIGPAVGWIIAGVQALWGAVKVQLGYFVTGLKQVGSWGMWLWKNAISPAVNGVLVSVRIMYAGAKLILLAFVASLKQLGSWGMWLWKTAISPAMSGIRTVIAAVYNTGVKPVITSFKTLIGSLGTAFSSAVTAIKAQWTKLKAVARAPVQYVVDVVYNRGIVGTWNSVASAFGAPKLSKYKFATGGPVFGAGTETSDDVPAWLSKNEHVWTAREVRGAGGHGAVMALRKWAASGGNGNAPGFAGGGGLFGWAKSAASAAKGFGSDAWNVAKSAAGWIKDGIESSARAGVNAVVNPLLSKIPGLNSGWGQAIKGLPARAIDAMFGYSKQADKEVSKSLPNIGGAGVTRWRPYVVKALSANHLSTAAAMVAKVLRQISTESGGNPNAVQGNIGDINNKTGDLAKGLLQTISATFNAYKFPGHGNIFNGYDNLLAALNYAKHRYGPGLSALGQGHGYASGTTGARRGWAWVGELGPELVRFGGGETVLNHRDSLRAALAMGRVGGYATGTSKAARKEVPGDLTAFTKALSGSASDIRAAANSLINDLKRVGGAGGALAKRTGQVSAQLQSLATKSKKIADQIAAAKSFAADQKAAASDFTKLSSVSDATSVKGLITGLRDRQTQEKATQTQISSLAKRGASKDLISQLIASGPGSDLTALVASASGTDLKTLNSLVSSGTKLAGSYGNQMADLMFDAGNMAGKGFLTGLQAQEAGLKKEMSHLADILVGTVEHKLGIHSPAKRTQWTGEMAGAGVQVGLDKSTSDVAAAAARVADAAVPSVRPFTPGGGSAAASAADQIVVELHTRDEALADFVDVRVRQGNRVLTGVVGAGRRKGG
ncbi:phage tail tape measure protein [Streptomyces sp. NPDC010273]|uniref:phage tail tape measure protein n=1 Tax=Streptomyces sp. NPDC010273 TaxID=3364829 RepID=UPI0036EE6F7E